MQYINLTGKPIVVQIDGVVETLLPATRMPLPSARADDSGSPYVTYIGRTFGFVEGNERSMELGTVVVTRQDNVPLLDSGYSHLVETVELEFLPAAPDLRYVVPCDAFHVAARHADPKRRRKDILTPNLWIRSDSLPPGVLSGFVYAP